ncbi:MlaD family protein [Mariniblastus sp.]|nr:MlaD family protein [Mariniblastus sp.]
MKKFRVGMFVLMGFLLLGILILVNTEGGWLGWTSQITVYAQPEQAPGVQIGTPIRKNGILIGRVKKVSSQDDHVLLELGINKKERIYQNETCRIATESFLGDAVVQFFPMSANERGALIGDGATIKKPDIEPNPLEIMANFGDLQPRLDETLLVIQDGTKSFQSAAVGVSQLTRSFDGFLKDDKGDFSNLVQNLNAVSRKADLALDSFNSMFENLNNIVGDPKLKAEFKNSLAELPKIFQEVRVTIADTRQAVQQYGTIPDNVNNTLKQVDGTLSRVDKTAASIGNAADNVGGFADTLNDNTPEILAKVQSSLASVDKFLKDAKKITKQFENFDESDSTIAKLLSDDEIYESILKTTRNVEEVSARLEPLMDDIRLFGDALARDPGQLGVRGALDRRPGKTGYKGNAGRGGLLGIPARQ